VDLGKTARELPDNVAVQGNMAPVILNTTPDITNSAATKILDNLKGRPGHVFNLGHGVLPQAKIACVEAMMETVVNYAS